MTVPTESWGGQQGSSEGEGRRERKEPKPVVEAGEDLASGSQQRAQHPTGH